jgi:hypothetical protein
MDYFSFEADSFDCDFETEDFGLAKSFSNAPLTQIAPLATFNNTHEDSVEKEIEMTSTSEVRADGFCFKLCPTADQVQFQRSLKTLAPKMTDFAKGTTTCAFEFKGGVLVAVDARAT